LMKRSTNPWETVRQSVVKMLSDVFSVSQDDVALSIEKPPDSALGDLASTIAFSLAKKHKKSPVAIITESLSKLEAIAAGNPLVKEVNANGPYINIFLDHGKMAELTIKSVIEYAGDYGRSKVIDRVSRSKPIQTLARRSCQKRYLRRYSL